MSYYLSEESIFRLKNFIKTVSEKHLDDKLLKKIKANIPDGSLRKALIAYLSSKDSNQNYLECNSNWDLSGIYLFKDKIKSIHFESDKSEGEISAHIRVALSNLNPKSIRFSKFKVHPNIIEQLLLDLKTNTSLSDIAFNECIFNDPFDQTSIKDVFNYDNSNIKELFNKHYNLTYIEFFSSEEGMLLILERSNFGPQLGHFKNDSNSSFTERKVEYAPSAVRPKGEQPIPNDYEHLIKKSREENIVEIANKSLRDKLIKLPSKIDNFSEQSDFANEYKKWVNEILEVKGVKEALKFAEIVEESIRSIIIGEQNQFKRYHDNLDPLLKSSKLRYMDYSGFTVLSYSSKEDYFNSIYPVNEKLGFLKWIHSEVLLDIINSKYDFNKFKQVEDFIKLRQSYILPKIYTNEEDTTHLYFYMNNIFLPALSLALDCGKKSILNIEDVFKSKTRFLYRDQDNNPQLENSKAEKIEEKLHSYAPIFTILNDFKNKEELTEIDIVLSDEFLDLVKVKYPKAYLKVLEKRNRVVVDPEYRQKLLEKYKLIN